MAYTLPVGNLVNVRVDYVDVAGHPATVETVDWASNTPDIADVVVDADDEHICTVIAGDLLGTTQITATADADLGEGVRHIITTFDVTVVAGEAVAGTISPTGDSQPVAPHPEPQRRGGSVIR
jgi:hypothetical protein